MRVAVLADIHGNILALEAVLTDLAHRRPDLIVDLGDRASGPLWPRETLDRLASIDALTVRGNHDRWLAALEPAEMGPSDRFAFNETSASQRAALGAIPVTRVIAPGILAFHATPTDDNSYLLDVVEGGRVVRDHRDRIAERLGKVEARLVLCGHSHRPDIVKLPDGPLILNPGSIGCPAYEDGTYVSESGSPHARYAIVETRADKDFAIELFTIPYNNEAAARRAEKNGRAEWAHGLRTGFMPPLAS